MKNIFFYDTPLGSLGIVSEQDMLIRLYFPTEKTEADVILKETAILKRAGLELKQYFSGKLKAFSLPLAPKGTEFQKRVWQELCSIQYGVTTSYKEIAEKLENPLAMRAIGQANNRNPLPIFIPCHRVIGSNGKLIGYAGGLENKKLLLKLERDCSENMK
ncbi:MAG: methylated-DNA--[protein]-cysteine S-methyltransferase [Clostridia bacterium]